MAEINLAALLGGVGLFLLGMTMMSGGLKLSLGPALTRRLRDWTHGRVRGLVFGSVATALMQSSTATTVATIGFVNAGLLPLGQSLWVIFGANLGSTVTSWLIALIGFKFKLEAAALPVIGLGVLLHLSGTQTRRGAAGSALAGLGLLFLGIGFLQQGFASSTEHLDLQRLSGYGLWSLIAFVLAGMLLTVLLQASAATLAIVLTLAEAGVLPLSEAAAAVIGANIGTAVGILFVLVGATPNAKRAAIAHVAFNAVTGIVATLALPLLLFFIETLRQALGIGPQPALSLALFHTLFKLLGVTLMWPLAKPLTRFLKRRFKTEEESLGKPRYIDRSVAKTPSLAVDALHREIARLGDIILEQSRRRCLPDAQNWPNNNPFPTLARAIVAFVNDLNQRPMPEHTASELAQLLRSHRYYDNCHELYGELNGLHGHIAALAHPRLASESEALAALAADLLWQLDPARNDFQAPAAELLQTFETPYQALKAGLLQAGAAGALDIEHMDQLMNALSALRRLLTQAHKAAALLSTLSPVPADIGETGDNADGNDNEGHDSSKHKAHPSDGN
ncbi:Na/Pi cotransporter family protein [Azonexus sp.]|uniref:Na/Pi cotransporter family protein n=1 Tax=Azonexus sp. TaxID=1872668 RepID=UPI0039E432BE